MNGIDVRRFLVIVCVLISMVLITEPSMAQMRHNEHGRSPYGSYHYGPRWGWYGAKREVKTTNEARKILEQYFENEDFFIGDVKENGRFFRAEIRDRNKILIDRVIIDKRTGRIRSIY